MSSKDALEFLDRILKNFPPYNWTEDRQKEWVTSVVREVGRMPRDVLMRAADEIVRTRKAVRTPVVAELVEACKEAKYWVERESSKDGLPLDKDDVRKFALWSDERLRLANDLVMTPVGKAAAKEGWIRGLHDFIREHARMPAENEIVRLRIAARDFNEEYEKCLRGTGPLMKSLAELGGKMVKRGEELADMVLHGVVK